MRCGVEHGKRIGDLPAAVGTQEFLDVHEVDREVSGRVRQVPPGWLVRDVVVKGVVDGDVVAGAGVDLRSRVTDVTDAHADPEVDILGEWLRSRCAGHYPGLVQVRRPGEYFGVELEQVPGRRVCRA